MRKRLMASVATALVMTAPSHAAAKVLGKDTRRPVGDAHRQLANAVGLLQDTVTRSFCTAFCVAPDVIATSAHCIAWRLRKLGGGKRNVRDFMFRIVFNGSQLGKETLAWNHLEPIGEPELSLLFGREVKGVMQRKARDWALAKLYAPMCGNRQLQLATDDELAKLRRKRRAKITTLGFHRDVDRAKGGSYWQFDMRVTACNLTVKRTGTLVEHDCDTEPRSSGSPVIMTTANGPRVIAINQGWRDYYRWRRNQSGKKIITKRWAKNYAVLTTGLGAKAGRLTKMTLIPAHQTLSKARLVDLMKRTGMVAKRVSANNWSAVATAIRRHEEKQGYTPTGLASKQLLDDLLRQTSTSLATPASDSVPVQYCDRLAARPYGVDKLAQGVFLSRLDATAAIAACQHALENYPDATRFMFLLARANLKAKRYTVALSLFEKAAQRGDARAINGLGYMYLGGRGVTRSYRKALQYFQQAAQLNDPVAHNNLGWMHEHGFGVDRDYAKARGYYGRAIAAGYARSRKNLERLQAYKHY